MKLVLNKHQLNTAMSLAEDSTTKIAIKQLQDGVYAWRENDPGARLGSIRLDEVQVSEWPFELDASINASLTINSTVSGQLELFPNPNPAEINSRWAAASPWLD